MKIKVPIPVKMVVTNNYKANMIVEIEKSIKQIKIELEQLQFQQKKLLSEAKKKGNEAVRIVQERIGYEHQRRKEKLDKLVIQLEQVERLKEGEEIFYSTVESEIEIKVGDSWDEINRFSEIVVKDGVIIDIRGKGV
ncbi:YlqD family protein [Vulcanibacillus modesticaldus]|nr:YlqD family protein [Vulcanibacillus modesticaldus]